MSAGKDDPRETLTKEAAHLVRKVTLGFLLLIVGLIAITASLAQARPYRPVPAWADEAIRLHVVAHSDDQADQELKRMVRDVILDVMTPVFEASANQAEAMEALRANLPRIEAEAAEAIRSSGADYPVRAELGRFAFPARAYGPVLLPAGDYTALRILIGAAEGANWWCVLFPPMCFLDWSAGIVLEPAPGSGAAETVALPRREAALLLDEEDLKNAPVRPRSALIDWMRSRRDEARRRAAEQNGELLLR